MEKMTIKDIAKLVGVSTATVSNYLNGNFSKMSAETQKKLANMINETHYVPSSVARGLATNDNRTIGVSVADITNPFTSTVLSGIYEECEKRGYTVIFTNASGDPKIEIENITKLKQQEVSGLIIDPVESESPIYKTVSNAEGVMIDRQTKEIRIDTIVTDNFDSVKKFVTKMKESEYTQLFYVSWPLKEVSTRWTRYKGFLAATGYEKGTHFLEVHNTGDQMPFQSELANVMDNNKNEKIGFFTMNGRVLIRVLAAMQSLGLDYPKNYGVGTYEDLDWMGVMRPGISCISQDSFKIGTKAVQVLDKKLRLHQTGDPKLIYVPTTERLRSSF